MECGASAKYKPQQEAKAAAPEAPEEERAPSSEDAEAPMAAPAAKSLIAGNSAPGMKEFVVEGDFANDDSADDSDASISPGASGARSTGPSGAPGKLFKKEEKLEEKLVGVVVTIFEGSSYDEMFREVRPVTVPGERVSTYTLPCRAVARLLALLESPAPTGADGSGSGAGNEPGAAADGEAAAAWRQLVEDLRAVEPDSVVLNWECCSACGDCKFPSCGADEVAWMRRCQRGACRSARAAPEGGDSATMRLMGLAVRNGFTVMCSDFSLKSLIHEWSEEQLGPNPFLKVGACDHQFCLEFNPASLQHDEVPQQLQVVGELCAERGKAVVRAMGDTIVYTVNPRRAPTDLYELKVLTVVTDHGSSTSVADAMLCSVDCGASGEKRGTAGHVSLTYRSGGQLITSNGHWIELTRLDATVESVQRVAERNFGATEAKNFLDEVRGINDEVERSEAVQSRARKYVQQSVASRMRGRTKY